MHTYVPAWSQRSQFGLADTDMEPIVCMWVRVNDVGLYFAICHALTVGQDAPSALDGAVVLNHGNSDIGQFIEMERFFPRRGN